jgi:phosphatidylglycerophosphatase C
VFDLDGTLSRRDTLAAFIGFILGRGPRRLARLLALPPALVGYAFHRDRGLLKARLLRALLGPVTRAQFEALAADFLDERWPDLFRPGALVALERHRLAGDRLVILSASVDGYVRAIGARLAVDEVICTELAWRDARLAGTLASPNRRGAEKTRCIAALRARHPGLAITAYGNAASDLDHLSAVEHGVLVNGAAGARREAVRRGLATGDWP